MHKRKKDGEMSSFFEAPKTFVYVYNTALMVLGISKERKILQFFNPLQAF